MRKKKAPVKRKNTRTKSKAGMVGTHVFTVDVEMLRLTMLVVFGTDKASIKKQFKSASILDFIQEGFFSYIDDCHTRNGSTLSLVNEDDKKHGIVIHINNPDLYKFQSVVVHEVSHAVDFITKAIGASEETEFRAYLSEHLFREICGYRERVLDKQSKK